MSQLLISISEIPQLSSGARRALIGLISFRNQTTGQCNPGITTLCGRVQAPRRSVCRWLAELRARGIVASKKPFGGTSRYEFPALSAVFANSAKSGTRNSAKSGTPIVPKVAPFPPLYEQTKGEQNTPRAEARSAAPPLVENSPSAAPDLPGVARKDVGRETGPLGDSALDLYYSAIFTSLKTRGRLLSTAEQRQVSHLMMLQKAREVCRKHA